jgi:HEAT repeat protein
MSAIVWLVFGRFRFACVGVLGVSVLGIACQWPSSARAGEASKEQVEAWIHQLQTDPIKERHRLMAFLRAEAAPHATHPPTRSSDRTDLLPVLTAALENDDDRVRTEAICALCYMKCKATFPILEKAFESRHTIVRYYATMGVEWLGDFDDLRPRAVSLFEMVRDREGEDINVRLAATTSLANLGVPQEAKIFIEALRDPRANEALAAGMLNKMGRTDTIELMIARLRTAVPSADHWLTEALAGLTGQNLGTNAKAWQDWLDAHRAEFPEQLK